MTISPSLVFATFPIVWILLYWHKPWLLCFAIVCFEGKYLYGPYGFVLVLLTIANGMHRTI